MDILKTLLLKILTMILISGLLVQPLSAENNLLTKCSSQIHFESNLAPQTQDNFKSKISGLIGNTIYKLTHPKSFKEWNISIAIFTGIISNVGYLTTNIIDLLYPLYLSNTFTSYYFLFLGVYILVNFIIILFNIIKSEFSSNRNSSLEYFFNSVMALYILFISLIFYQFQMGYFSELHFEKIKEYFNHRPQINSNLLICDASAWIIITLSHKNENIKQFIIN